MANKVIILGSGTSTGVPQIGCTCAVCKSKDPKDMRMRASILFENEHGRLLIDCGPDFRIQVLSLPFKKIDGVLLTHEHYDHVGGLDDLRPFCKMGPVSIFAEKEVAGKLRLRMPYCFVEHTYPGIPNILLHEIVEGVPLDVHHIKVLPLRIMHGSLPIVGYRIENMAYITDMSLIPAATYEQLKGLDVLIMNALRINYHPTHQNLAQALENAKRIGAKRTYFIHMSHEIGLHAEVNRRLPDGMSLTYDGQIIEF